MFSSRGSAYEMCARIGYIDECTMQQGYRTKIALFGIEYFPGSYILVWYKSVNDSVPCLHSNEHIVLDA